MFIIGSKWKLIDGRIVIITQDLANDFIRVLNEFEKLEVIHESKFRSEITD